MAILVSWLNSQFSSEPSKPMSSPLITLHWLYTLSTTHAVGLDGVRLTSGLITTAVLSHYPCGWVLMWGWRLPALPEVFLKYAKDSMEYITGAHHCV